MAKATCPFSISCGPAPGGRKAAGPGKAVGRGATEATDAISLSGAIDDLDSLIARSRSRLRLRATFRGAQVSRLAGDRRTKFVYLRVAPRHAARASTSEALYQESA